MLGFDKVTMTLNGRIPISKNIVDNVLMLEYNRITIVLKNNEIVMVRKN